MFDRGQRLTRLGFGGTSPTFWAAAVALQYDRIRTRQLEFASLLDDVRAGRARLSGLHDDPRNTVPMMLTFDAIFLTYAADHTVTLCERVQELTDDAAMTEALAVFRAAHPDLQQMRDRVAHFDEYGLGVGRFAPDEMYDGPRVEWVDEDDLRSELRFIVGPTHQVLVHALAPDVAALARIADAVWERRHEVNRGQQAPPDP